MCQALDERFGSRGGGGINNDRKCACKISITLFMVFITAKHKGCHWLRGDYVFQFLSQSS